MLVFVHNYKNQFARRRKRYIAPSQTSLPVYIFYFRTNSKNLASHNSYELYSIFIPLLNIFICHANLSVFHYGISRGEH